MAEKSITIYTTVEWWGYAGAPQAYTNALSDDLSRAGWRVLSVRGTPSANSASQVHVEVDVIGSTSDNLDAVAVAMRNALTNLGIPVVGNTIARWYGNSAPQQTQVPQPQTQAPSEQGVNLFSFQWRNVMRGGYDVSNLKPSHDAFNASFVRAFPRILYTNPFTTYTNGGLGIGSSVSALGETRLNRQQALAQISALLANAGFQGNPNDVQFSFDAVGRNTTILAPQGTVNPLVTTDGANAAMDKFWDSLGLTLGVSATTAIVLAVIVGVIAIKK